MSNRDAFLQRVRDAVRSGNRPGSSAAPPVRGSLGYQGAGPDAVTRFLEEFRAAGGQPHRATDEAAASARVLELVQEKESRRILLGRGRVLDRLQLADRLRERGLEVMVVDRLPEDARSAFFAADLGISGVDYLVAETGSVVELARPEEPRSLTLLPPIHIAVADTSQLLPDLFDLFGALGADGPATPLPPSCVSIITGPSKTGDIELRLVTGVHGPGEIHVVLIAG